MADSTAFSNTCNRLSQFLKERRGLGDLALGIMPCNNSNSSEGPVTTMNLFPIDDKVGDVSPNTNIIAPQNLRSMEFYPQQVGFVPKSNVQNSVNKTGSVEPKSAQMTIFYKGQVIVFDDFPADKATEVMNLAKAMESMNLASKSSFPSVPIQGQATFNPNAIKSPIEVTSPIVPTTVASPNFGANSIQKFVQPSRQPIANDLPIARKASLHRFLEKRKDRITSKAPYRTSISSANPSKPVESNLWLGLGAQSHQ